MNVKRISCNSIVLMCSLNAAAQAEKVPAVDFANSCGNDRVEAQSDQNLSRQLDSKQAYPEPAEGKKVVAITLKQLNVFDTDKPEEDNALFRFANRYHIQTKPEVLKSVLLFQEGDAYNPRKLSESERLLRNQSYLYDARIYAVENCDGDILVTVVTRDLWTLLPDLSFSRSGGENTSRIGFRESNLFGWGKRLSFTHIQEVDRSGYQFVYDDPNILNSRYRGRVEYSDNDDGERHYIDVSYPFFATDTPYSYGFTSYSDKREEPIYSEGETISEFSQSTDVTQVYFGHSKALSGSWTRRLIAGVRHEQHTFREIADTTLPIAQDRTLTYPYVQAQWFEDSYVKVRNFDSIYRTEDLNLGWNINALFGYSAESWSDDTERLVYSFSANTAHYTSDHSLWRFYFDVSGNWNKDTDKTENLIAKTTFQYYLNTSLYESWFINASYTYGNNLTFDNQITLGGETGLRGYPIKYQQGSRSMLLNIEKRYYWEYDLLRLFKIGGAAFFDVGRAYHSHLPIEADESVLKNVGIGLRLAPSRANSDIMVHIDLAAPINGPDNVDSVQWLLTVKNRF
ncbi:Outer membrane protein assembly factor BamA [Pseudoalteromonas sp. NC201]|nr:Outer membrane protein assembly factor BamA [Pseudoalteromonas sp. NC201]